MNNQSQASESAPRYIDSLSHALVPIGPINDLTTRLSVDALVEQTLYTLEPHSLDSLINAVLMNRVDTKFLLPAALVVDLLSCMSEAYSVLEIDGQRSFNYVTTYYDTPQNTHYLAHHNGRLNRFKIRKRTYVESRSRYLEVKFKDNHGRTTKTRMACRLQGFDLDREALDFLEQCGVPEPIALQSVQTGVYRRVALANEAAGERLTIDFNLAFTDEHNGTCRALGPWVIVEVKQSLMNRKSIFFAWAKRHGIQELPFSKYCMGVYYTGAGSLKRNNFHFIARKLRT